MRKVQQLAHGLTFSLERGLGLARADGFGDCPVAVRGLELRAHVPEAGVADGAGRDEPQRDLRALEQLHPDGVLAVQVEIADRGLGQLRLRRGLSVLVLAAPFRFGFGLRLVAARRLLLVKPAFVKADLAVRGAGDIDLAAVLLPRFTLPYWWKCSPVSMMTTSLQPASRYAAWRWMTASSWLPEFLRVVEIPLLAEQVGDDGAAVLLGREQRG